MKLIEMIDQKALLDERLEQYHDDKHHFSNWCRICGLYYCWHLECVGHWHDNRALGHKFEPCVDENDYPVKKDENDDKEG